MTTPVWPEHGADLDRYYPWHLYTGPHGDMHAGYLLDTILGPDVVTGEQRVYEVLRCEPCLAVHVTPLPESEKLAHYYATQFYEREKPDYIARYEKDRAWWEKAVHQPILQSCKDSLRLDCPEADQVRFLDIGTGPGIALDVARQRFGWQTWGIEPNRHLAATVAQRGHTMCGWALEDRPREWSMAGFFQIVMAYEVLEHQACPEDFLLQCYALLEEGGLLVVVVPNDYNVLQMQVCRTLGLPRYWLAPPQHLFYWSPKRLPLLLRRCGFEVCTMRSTYPLEHFMLDEGRVYVGNDAVGRQCHAERMAYELEAVNTGKWIELEQKYRVNCAQGIGRELVAICRKGV